MNLSTLSNYEHGPFTCAQLGIKKEILVGFMQLSDNIMLLVKYQHSLDKSFSIMNLKLKHAFLPLPLCFPISIIFRDQTSLERLSDVPEFLDFNKERLLHNVINQEIIESCSLNSQLQYNSDQI